MLKKILLLSLLIFQPLIAEEAKDTTHTPIIKDTTKPDTLQFDTTGIDVDTLSEGQKAYQRFLSRQQKRKEENNEPKEVKTYLSFYDSLVVAFLHPKLNQETELTRSFIKDAGDYFKTDPSFFVRDYQISPMRKTVRPFGLSGNRLNIISNGLVMNPFEHYVEPDGLIDFNTIQTGVAKDIYILPGSIGQLFGGEQSIASLVTVPRQPTTYEPEIKLHVDKGAFDYAYTRGGYTKLFTDGKELDLSIDYRKSLGITGISDNKGKNYAGRTIIPLKPSIFLRAGGRSYRRTGNFVTEIIANAPYIRRSTTDNIGEIALESLNENQNVKYSLGYKYLKQNSNLDVNYIGRYNYFGNSIQLTRESAQGNRMYKSEMSYSYLDQTNGGLSDSEKSGKAIFSVFQKNDSSSVGITIGTSYNEEYRFLPFASIVYQKNSENQLSMLSLGYSEKAPTMHDQNLSYQQTAIYVSDTIYAETGNKYLLSEKQLIGSLILDRGVQNNIRLSVTGGIINDGIDWTKRDSVINATNVRFFKPENSDITFADVQLKQYMTVSDLIKFSIGGAYHYIDYENNINRAYQPEYQFFVGGELHQYWKQKLIHLYAYGEASYVGPYEGYAHESLGENIIINTGLAFTLKKFRFYYIFQNSLKVYRPNLDGYNYYGLYKYYGFTWYFIN